MVEAGFSRQGAELGIRGEDETDACGGPLAVGDESNTDLTYGVGPALRAHAALIDLGQFRRGRAFDAPELRRTAAC
jgi:hypothetical protein